MLLDVDRKASVGALVRTSSELIEPFRLTKPTRRILHNLTLCARYLTLVTHSYTGLDASKPSLCF